VLKRVFGASDAESLLEELPCEYFHRTIYGGKAEPSESVRGRVVAGPSGEDPCTGALSSNFDGSTLDRYFLGAFEGPGVITVAVRPHDAEFRDKEFTYHVEITKVPLGDRDTQGWSFVAYHHKVTHEERKNGQIDIWRPVRPWTFDVNKKRIRAFTEDSERIEKNHHFYSDDPKYTDLITEGPTPLYRVNTADQQVVALVPADTKIRVAFWKQVIDQRFYEVVVLDEDD
jgi:hypothetical protein